MSDTVATTAAELGAFAGLLHAHRRLTEVLDGELERAHGISLAEYDVLISLARAPGGHLRMADLAEAVLLSRSGLTRLVDRLQARGLVARVRCDADARGLNATLTAAGRDRVREATATHLAGVRAHFLTHLTPDDASRLNELWRRLGFSDAACTSGAPGSPMP
jgi:DNA-binding MarR family transcriptional regulator